LNLQIPFFLELGTKIRTRCSVHWQIMAVSPKHMRLVQKALLLMPGIQTVALQQISADFSDQLMEMVTELLFATWARTNMDRLARVNHSFYRLF